MQFLDKVTITVESGKWGDGCVSGRREKWISHGGPSGGNGGKWGSIILQADENVNTLVEYKYIKNYKADIWENGRSKEQYGANAENLTLKIPVWTLISDAKTWAVLHYFAENKGKYTIVEGGKGGDGNMEFKSPVLQYPDFATLGEPGHIHKIVLELQLLGDVALVWTPSVGKSTLINAISNTKAKVANYHFTTLVPHLWSVKFDDYSFNVVDVPGLIKWAAEGKGLGNDFLRHILKAKIFCLMSDIYKYNQGMQEIFDLLEELFSYMLNLDLRDEDEEQKPDQKITIEQKNQHLLLSLRKNNEVVMEKLIVFVFNKFDLISDEEIAQEYIDEFIKKTLKYTSPTLKKTIFAAITDKTLKKNSFVISAATHHGLPELLRFRADQLEYIKLKNLDRQTRTKKHYQIGKQEKKFMTDITKTEKPKLIKENYIEEFAAQFAKIRYVDNTEISRLVYTLQRGNDQAEMRFWKRLEDEWFLELFQEAGAAKGDIFKIKTYYEDYEERYIQW